MKMTMMISMMIRMMIMMMITSEGAVPDITMFFGNIYLY